MKRLRQTNRPVPYDSARSGTAAVECALVSPLLVLMVLGAIDVGQFVNVSQVVDNSAREGARKAIRDSTGDAAEVEAAVKNYLATYFPDLSSSEIDAATSVRITTPDLPDDGDTSPQVINGTNLASVSSGTQVSVRVTFEYDKVRWMSAFPTLSSKSLKTTAVMRRE